MMPAPCAGIGEQTTAILSKTQINLKLIPGASMATRKYASLLLTI
jgi:hypothetical protein